MITDEQIEKARENFRLASLDYGFVFHSPFELDEGLTAFAHIENYGSKNGVVICLFSEQDITTDNRITEWCKKMNCFYSFLNIDLLKGKYSRACFREMLRDWGYFE